MEIRQRPSGRLGTLPRGYFADGSRRRRGCHDVDSPRRRVAAGPRRGQRRARAHRFADAGGRQKHIGYFHNQEDAARTCLCGNQLVRRPEVKTASAYETPQRRRPHLGYPTQAPSTRPSKSTASSRFGKRTRSTRWGGSSRSPEVTDDGLPVDSTKTEERRAVKTNGRRNCVGSTVTTSKLLIQDQPS